MKKFYPPRLAKIFIALVWLINGLLCKICNLVPRHREIVAAIASKDAAPFLTISIGLAEVAMAAWVLTGKKPKSTAVFQIVIILTMNLIEFTLAPNLLLWGKFNLIFALLFCTFIYYHYFIQAPKNNLNLNV